MDHGHPVSESELEIMRILWQQEGPMMLAPLMEALKAQGRHWKPNTVLTFLSRLVDKGMLRVEKVGRLNQYAPLITESAYLASLTRSFVMDVYGGDAKGLVATLLAQTQFSGKDLEELRAYWEEAQESG